MARYPSGAARIARAVVATAITIPLLAFPLSPSSDDTVSSVLSPSYAWADTNSTDGTISAASREKTLVSFAASVQDTTKELVQKAKQILSKKDLTLSYDPSLIAEIGSQETSGHWICCPGYACAYGDAIIQGVANSHDFYGCGCCTWPNWGGGGSSFRTLESDQALLREAYDGISAGKPTVIHVAGTSGEHWICLMGYRDVDDPGNLTLANFIALDPVDGAQITASDRYSLYGDACEHVSDAL